MAKYIHRFNTTQEFENAYDGDKYIEPWVSYTRENEQVDYNHHIPPMEPIPTPEPGIL